MFLTIMTYCNISYMLIKESQRCVVLIICKIVFIYVRTGFNGSSTVCFILMKYDDGYSNK